MSQRMQRLIFIIFSLIFLFCSALIIFNNIRENVVFFLTPSEIIKKNFKDSNKIRVGGYVQLDSLKFNENSTEVKFIISDNVNDLKVIYFGITPDLFSEGSGVVAEGKISDNILLADKIFAKHDENYMPKQVVDQIKESGSWKIEYK